MVLGVVYCATSFAYSFVAFVSREPVIHFHEYSSSSLMLEIGGHIGFGMIAAFPLLDMELILLSGILAILIDVDHVLTALNLATNGRPSHSFMFIPIAFLMLVCVGRKIRLTNRRSVEVAALAGVAFLAHIAYDIFAAYVIFAGRGASFPLFTPFSFTLISFPYWAWVVFEAAALAVAGAMRFIIPPFSSR